VGRAMEARTERLRDNLRRQHASGGDQLMKTATYTVDAIVPRSRGALAGSPPKDPAQRTHSWISSKVATRPPVSRSSRPFSPGLARPIRPLTPFQR
jgi:hypothetical protein